jgi:hypothetical protein
MVSKLGPDQWKVLSPRLDEALEMTEEARSIWLASLRAENPNLATQLETLLQEQRVLSEVGFLEKRSIGLPGGPGLLVKRLVSTRWFHRLVTGGWALSG